MDGRKCLISEVSWFQALQCKQWFWQPSIPAYRDGLISTCPLFGPSVKGDLFVEVGVKTRFLWLTCTTSSLKNVRWVCVACGWLKCELVVYRTNCATYQVRAVSNEVTTCGFVYVLICWLIPCGKQRGRYGIPLGIFGITIYVLYALGVLCTTADNHDWVGRSVVLVWMMWHIYRGVFVIKAW